MKQLRMIKTFGKNEDGNVAAMFGLSLLGILTIIGATMDYSMSSSSKDQAQNFADALALNAASFVRENDVVPTAESGGIPPGTYTAEELGFETRGWMVDGAGGLVFDLEYDMENGEALVTVRGKSIATFSQIMGKTDFPFSATSVVGFESDEISNVASVVLVLDNSGSMAWADKPYTASGQRPAGAIRRIDGLKTSISNFMDYLSPLLEDKPVGKDKVFRSGLIAYNTGMIAARRTPMSWGLLRSTSITTMVAGGGTNSTTSMREAANWLTREPQIHLTESGKEPLRYVVFMSDGANNNNNATWTPGTSGTWRRSNCTRPNTSSGWSCYTEYTDSASNPGGTVGYTNGWKDWTNAWQEGTLSGTDDEATLAECTRMKNDGVTVYTIGFGLETGTYDQNPGVNNGTIFIDPGTSQRAYDFLEACASSTDTFIKAENADALQSAFDFIGEDIVTDSIRIKA